MPGIVDELIRLAQFKVVIMPLLEDIPEEFVERKLKPLGWV